MTPAQYAEQNAKGFEGDGYLKKEMENLVEKHGINWIIETGTYKGATTREFAKMVLAVSTVEINSEYLTEASAERSFGCPIYYHLGSSVDHLPQMLKKAESSKTLIYIDSHWGEYNPLLEELEIIAQSGMRPVIIIHDFKVPDHPELGFDSYGGQDYDFQWIRESLRSIYDKESNYHYYYNSIAEGAKRGVIFIEPV